MFQNLTTSTIILALTLGLAACKKDAPAGTSNPPDGSSSDSGAAGDGGSPADGGGSSDGGGEGGDSGGDGGGKDLTQTVCDAEVSETPAVYFEETLMIRLPKGLNDENLVERQPGFAQTGSPSESVSCVPDLPGVEIRTAILGAFEDDPGKDMKTFATETITALGIPEGATFEDEAMAGRKIEMSINIPKGDNGPEGKAWLAMKAGGGFIFYAYYEVHPNTWNAIKKTFKASTDKMLILTK